MLTRVPKQVLFRNLTRGLSSATQECKKLRKKDFVNVPTAKEWLDAQDGARTGQWKEHWASKGYLVVQSLINSSELAIYREIYDELLGNSGDVDARAHRHDLGSNESQKVKGTENVCQIMWPSAYYNLSDGPLHKRAEAISRFLLGQDIAFDFDMLISKAPHTNTDVPWHSDEGYWLDMPDKRAASCWVAIDNATVDNGCMWFVPGSHLEPLLPHKPAKEGSHVLAAQNVDTKRGVPAPLNAGGATFHSGRTLHFTRGNTTGSIRRAFITNFRPQSMVEWEREKGYDHGRHGIRNETVFPTLKKATI